MAWSTYWGRLGYDETARSIAVRNNVLYAFYDGADASANNVARFDADNGHHVSGDLPVPYGFADAPQGAASIDVNSLGITVLMGGVPYGGTSPVVLLERLSFGGTVTRTRRIHSGDIEDYSATSVSLDSQGIVAAYLPVVNNGHPRVARYTLDGHKVFDKSLPGYDSAPAAGRWDQRLCPLRDAIQEARPPSESASDGSPWPVTSRARRTFDTVNEDVPYSILPSGSALYVGGASGHFDFLPILLKMHKPPAN